MSNNELSGTSLPSNSSSVEHRPSQTVPTNPKANSLQGPLNAFTQQIRDLSDIREASSSSKDGNQHRSRSLPPGGAFTRGKSSKPSSLPTSRYGTADMTVASEEFARPTSVVPSVGGRSRTPSVGSLPLKDVPKRRSSISFFGGDGPSSRRSSMNELSSWRLPPLSLGGQTVPSRGRARSPVKEAMRHDPVSSNTYKRSPSRTFVRTVPPLEILDNGNTRHGRVDMSLQTPAPLFVGGGTIEGHLLLTVDGGATRKTYPKPLSTSKLSIDVLGVEEVTEKRWVFLSLATELFDQQHPPPRALVTTQTPVSSGSELSWALRPASVIVPFCLNLPLNVGPPPYTSKYARIRYILCATAHIKAAGKLATVRQSFEVQMLAVYDPEKALSSLPNPLLAMEQLLVSHGLDKQPVKLTAGLHRQIWVNGAKIFVDVHISNSTSRTIKKIQVQLEKTTLWYPHAAAGTLDKSAAHLRLPKRTESERVCSTVIKKSKDWKGVPARTSEVRTCELEVPRGHVTISAGRYFEVRYFLNVQVSVTLFKSVAVQLPVTIIHINSLDIVPNSLAQVAASIEAKRARTLPIADEAIRPPFQQGQIFSAPRRQSLERMPRGSSSGKLGAVLSLSRDIENSPRKQNKDSVRISRRKANMSTGMSDNHVPSRFSTASSHHHLSRHDSCYHCHLHDAENPQLTRRRSSKSSLQGPQLPTLRLSTSGLGFSDSEFEIAPDSPPKKVMLSESERNLIQQERELKLQRQQSEKRKPASQRHTNASLAMAKGEQENSNQAVGPAPGGYWGWRNVALQPIATAGHDIENSGKAPLGKSVNPNVSGPARSRSNTGPGRISMTRSGHSMPKIMPMGSGLGQMPRRSRGSGAKRPSMEQPIGAHVPVGGPPRGFRTSVERR